MTYFKIFLCCLMLGVLGIAGCSNTSSSSGYGSGAGYKINLTTSADRVPQGGNAIIFANVQDAQGNPVNDSTSGRITFTSEWGGTISTAGPITMGNCTVTYNAPGKDDDDQPAVIVDRITASYQGAIAWVSIQVYKP
ncbi:MAG: hypothetical protein AB1585_06105 [Thermodesulfobacteriota bacterium]